MINRLDFRRLRRSGLALAAFALSTPFLLPAVAPGAPFFIRAAMAEDTQKADVSRVVSVGGAVTEIIYALGEEGRLVGRDSTSTYPEAAKTVPDVGYMRQLAPEGIIAVNPSAIVAVEGSGPPEALAVLKEANIAFYSRHGFEVTGEHDIAGGKGPRTWLMWRDPRPPEDPLLPAD